MVRTECPHALVTMHTVVKGQYVLSVCIECELVDMRWHCGCGVVSNGCKQPSSGEWYTLAALRLWGSMQALGTGLQLVSSKYCACCWQP